MGKSNFNVEDVFTDPDFDKLIRWYCFKRGLTPADMKQEVFAEILDCAPSSLSACRKIADRVTQEHRRLIDEIDDNEDILEDDEVVMRHTDNWYWRGVSPEMNEDVDPGAAWE